MGFYYLPNSDDFSIPNCILMPYYFALLVLYNSRFNIFVCFIFVGMKNSPSSGLLKTNDTAVSGLSETPSTHKVLLTILPLTILLSSSTILLTVDLVVVPFRLYCSLCNKFCSSLNDIIYSFYLLLLIYYFNPVFHFVFCSPLLIVVSDSC